MDCTVIIVPQQEGVSSTLQILVKPHSETVTVLEMFPYDECGAEHFPTHLVNEMFEASASAHELVDKLRSSDLMKIDAYDQCKCAVHLHHILDGEPVVCASLASAMLVASAVANND